MISIIKRTKGPSQELKCIILSQSFLVSVRISAGNQRSTWIGQLELSRETAHKDVGRVWGKQKKCYNTFSFMRVGFCPPQRDEGWECVLEPRHTELKWRMVEPQPRSCWCHRNKKVSFSWPHSPLFQVLPIGQTQEEVTGQVSIWCSVHGSAFQG